MTNREKALEIASKAGGSVSEILAEADKIVKWLEEEKEEDIAIPITGEGEDLIVDVKKSVLVELYQFAYRQAEKTGTINVLLDIDRRLHEL